MWSVTEHRDVESARHRGGAVGGATARGERVAWLRTLQHDPRTLRKGRALRSRILLPSHRRFTWSSEVAAVAAAAAVGGGGWLSLGSTTLNSISSSGLRQHRHEGDGKSCCLLRSASKLPVEIIPSGKGLFLQPGLYMLSSLISIWTKTMVMMVSSYSPADLSICIAGEKSPWETERCFGICRDNNKRETQRKQRAFVF